MFVEPDRFVGCLVDMPPVEIDRVASRLVAQHECAADEVDAWHATLAIDRTLRDLRRSREAAAWAHRAADAVRTSASRGGVAVPSNAVTTVARSAAEVSRALVAGDAVISELGWLLRPWNALLVARHREELVRIQSELALTNSSLR